MNFFLHPLYHKQNILTKLKQKSRITNVLFSILLFAGFWIIIYFRSQSGGWNINLLAEDSFSKFEVNFLMGFIAFGVSTYVMYLFLEFIKETKFKWLAIFIDISILLATIVTAYLIVFSKKIDLWGMIRDIISQSYNLLLSNKITPYAGFERFIAFGLIVLLLVFILTSLLYILYRIILPRNREFRIVYVLKYYGIILSLAGVLFILSVSTDGYKSMVEEQHRNKMRNDMVSSSYRIDAEVYQWYHQQQDVEKNTKVLPPEFTKFVEEMQDIEFTKSWDGILLETNIKYVQDDGEVKKITHKLNAETGELIYGKR